MNVLRLTTLLIVSLFYFHTANANTSNTPNTSPPTQPNAAYWNQIQSWQIYTLPDGRLHAEIVNRNANNDSQRFVFEGKQAEVRQQITQNQQLSNAQKQTLLQALNMNINPSQFFNQFAFRPNFNTLGNMPMFQPYNDAFFQQFFQNFYNNNGFYPAMPRHIPPVPGTQNNGQWQQYWQTWNW